MLRALRWPDIPRLAELERDAFAAAGWAERAWWAELAQRPRREYVGWEDPARGAVVGYADPHVPMLTLRSGSVLIDVVDPVAFGADLVVLHTRHAAADLAWAADAPILLDCTYRAAELGARATL